jgi:hypothetical protein
MLLTCVGVWPQVWTGSLCCGGAVVLFLNRGNGTSGDVKATWEMMGLKAQGTYQVGHSSLEVL